MTPPIPQPIERPNRGSRPGDVTEWKPRRMLASRSDVSAWAESRGIGGFGRAGHGNPGAQDRPTGPVKRPCGGVDWNAPPPSHRLYAYVTHRTLLGRVGSVGAGSPMSPNIQPGERACL